MNPIKLMNMAKKITSVEEALVFAEGLGINIQADPIPLEKKPTAVELEQLADLVCGAGGKMFRLRVKAGESERTISAILVMH